MLLIDIRLHRHREISAILRNELVECVGGDLRDAAIGVEGLRQAVEVVVSVAGEVGDFDRKWSAHDLGAFWICVHFLLRA